MKPFPLILFASAIAVGLATLAAEDRFARVDLDGNGILTMPEAVAAMPELSAEAFAGCDSDRSGGLSRSEFLAARNRGVLPGG